MSARIKKKAFPPPASKSTRSKTEAATSISISNSTSNSSASPTDATPTNKGKHDSKQNVAKLVKILNDDNPPPSSSSPSSSKLQSPTVTSVPLSPLKQITLSLSKSTTAKVKSKKMDHYVMQTIKAESSVEGMEESETIDFILTDNNDEEIGKPSGVITEELQISGDDEDADENYNTAEKTREIVEHVCGKCFKTFRRIKSLRRHLDYCRFDSGYHLRKAEMQKNLDKIEKDAVIMENKDICFCCGESYDTYHLGHINCPDCPKSFKTQMSYERHIFITHSEFDDHPCSICNAKLRSANLLKLHEEQHKNRGKPFACKVCGKDFTRSYHLQRHQKFSSCSDYQNNCIECKVCNKAFYRLDNLRAHLKLHLGTQAAKRPEYMCPICKNCFYSLSTLNIHTRTHTGERPFDCDLCEKKFPSLVALKKHRRYHTGEKPYTCSVCKQSFAVKEVLNRHMKRHTGERPYSCSECGKRFIQGVQLRNHIKTHLRPYACDDCSEKFKTEKQLARHSKVHRVTTKRRGRTRYPCRCNICRKGFPTEVEYKKHMDDGVHITPFQKRKIKNRTDCAVCKQNFDTVQSLQFHILKVHQEDPENFINEDPFGARSRSNSDSQESSASKVIKLDDSTDNVVKTIEFVTTDGEGKIVATTTANCNLINSSDDKNDSNNVEILQEFIIADDDDDDNGNNDGPSTSHNTNQANDNKETIILTGDTFTVIPLDSENGIIETSHTLPTIIAKQSNNGSSDKKKVQRKSLAESLAAAIADNDGLIHLSDEEEELGADDIKLKDNVNKLLDMLVDNHTLKKFGWPKVSEENVLCRVIENCGHNLSNDPYNYKEWDYGTRMREYVKLLFTVVIHNDSIKELLNNYPIDEVIEYVLGNDDDDDDDDNNDDDDDNVNDNDDVAEKVDKDDDANHHNVEKAISIDDDSADEKNDTDDKKHHIKDNINLEKKCNLLTFTTAT